MKMMIKILMYPILFLIYFLLSVVPIRAYEFPTDACYISVDDSFLGSIDIYVPCNTVTNLSLVNDHIVNVTSSSVTGYFVYDAEEYTISFQPFQFGRYRLTNSGYYSYLDTTFVEAVNFSPRSSVDNMSNTTVYLISTFILGGLLCLIFIKR